MGRPPHRPLTPATPPAPDVERRSGWFFLGLVVGWAVMAFGVVGALANSADTQPAALARWVIGSALAHDALLAPVVLLAGAALARAVPARWRPPVQSGLIVSGVILLVTFPLVRRYGVRPDNPTVLYRDYGGPLIAVLAAVWGVSLVALVVRGRRRL